MNKNQLESVALILMFLWANCAMFFITIHNVIIIPYDIVILGIVALFQGLFVFGYMIRKHGGQEDD